MTDTRSCGECVRPVARAIVNLLQDQLKEEVRRAALQLMNKEKLMEWIKLNMCDQCLCKKDQLDGLLNMVKNTKEPGLMQLSSSLILIVTQVLKGKKCTECLKAGHPVHSPVDCALQRMMTLLAMKPKSYHYLTRSLAHNLTKQSYLASRLIRDVVLLQDQLDLDPILQEQLQEPLNESSGLQE